MKKRGILNPEISRLIASMGDTDLMTICDKGFPVPMGPERIDLALVDDIPTVLEVLKAVAEEFNIDRIVITREMEEISPKRVKEIKEILPRVEIEVMPHLEFKELGRQARGVIRTADTVPYANIILVSG